MEKEVSEKKNGMSPKVQWAIVTAVVILAGLGIWYFLNNGKTEPSAPVVADSTAVEDVAKPDSTTTDTTAVDGMTAATPQQGNAQAQGSQAQQDETQGEPQNNADKERIVNSQNRIINDMKPAKPE